VSLVGLATPNLYQGAAAWTVQAVAQDLADLCVVLPLLAASALLAARGSLRAWLVWLGALSYVVYTFVIYAFGVQHNRYFLAYVAVLGCALWALAGGLVATDWADVKARFGPRAPTRWVALYLVVPGVLFYFVWLADELPAAIADRLPASLEGLGLLTNPVHVLDMAVMLPAMIVTGALLWRGAALGYGLAPVILVNMVLQNVAIATMMVLALRAGLGGSPAPIALFAALAALGLAMTTWYLRALHAAPNT
jgi:hypothetical protein